MIGVLGTIVGFYFASASDAAKVSPQLSITTSSIPDGIAGVEYRKAEIETVGGTPPLKWSIEPPLPAGLTLEGNIVSGKPSTVTPKQKYVLRVIDSAKPNSLSATKEMTLEIKAPGQSP